MNGIDVKLSEMLKYRGMTQKELAEAAGITEAAVSRYLKGERNPRGVTIAAMARALNVQVSELLDESEEDPEDVDRAVRLVARNAGNLTESQKMQILSALAKL